MFNRDFMNFHDIVLITAVAILIHTFVMPLYDRVGMSDTAGDNG